ncbi:uncharacterized protein EI90DRAFT_3117724 [Cantharellus anzutake]|uniref:uncharacterized protein n=1 Tax=Cantharellus anzutake TaxID=1750568 RepID=UPI00190833A2|nr:uncharacterized protein EI90DRAFT_3117724 [Cantharellus anzutake]KAF8339955.1 hypothetical protein EI90DRAFT_3117724 [Cantharellus anzutake]
MLLESVAALKSTGARECLEEVKALASGDPRRVEIALLPKTRQFLSSLQSSPFDTATQPVADLIVPAATTIFSPAAVLPKGLTNGRMNTVSAYEVSAALPLANDLGNMPAIDGASLSILGLSGHVGTVDEAALLHVGSLQPMATNHETVSYSENWDLLVPDNWNDTANHGSAGPFTATYQQLDASSHEARAGTLAN